MTMEETNVLCATNMVRPLTLHGKHTLLAWPTRPALCIAHAGPGHPGMGGAAPRTARCGTHVLQGKKFSTLTSLPRTGGACRWGAQETFEFEAQLPPGLWKHAADELDLRCDSRHFGPLQIAPCRTAGRPAAPGH